MDSWRNLIERYMTVREPLSIVFHLIDSRLATLSSTDAMAIHMVAHALRERRLNKKPGFRYVVVLTKVDKSKDKTINELKNIIMETLAVHDDGDGNVNESVEIIRTSSVSREGRDSVWSVLGEHIFLDAR